ncbi:MAG: trigger factor [Pseudomonadota bacterium]
MEVIEKSAEGLSRSFTVKVPHDAIDARVVSKLEEIKGQVRLKGFRPGKAPVSFLKKMYGKGMFGEVVQDLVQELNDKALSDRNLQPAVQPKVDIEGDVETIAGGGDLQYDLHVEVLPEVEPVDVADIELTRPVAEVPAEDVENALKELAEGQREFAERQADATAEDGDQLDIDFVGKIDGEPFDGGTGEGIALIIGSGQFIPGFEEQLAGVKVGDEKVVKVTFPEDYQAEHLAGKEAEFDVSVNKISAPKDVEIDDEMAKKLGVESLDKLKETLGERLGEQFKQMSRAHAKRALLDKLDETHSFDLPRSMVDQEFEQIWQQVESAERDEEDKDKSEDELKAEYRTIAERRVRLGLVLAEIGKRHKVEVPNDQLQQAMIAQARQYPGQEREVLEFFQKNPGALAQVRAPLFEERVVDLIFELAKVTDKTVSKDELMKDPGEE